MKRRVLVCLLAGSAVLAGCEAAPYGSYDQPSYAYSRPYSSYDSGYYSGTSVPYGPGVCADIFHQNRPGGTDYYGPPVPGC